MSAIMLYNKGPILWYLHPKGARWHFMGATKAETKYFIKIVFQEYDNKQTIKK